MIVRPGLVEDAPALCRIDRLTWAPDNSPVPAPSGPVTPYEARLRRGEVLVALWDGAVCGYLGLENQFSVPSHLHVALLDVAVDPGFQGRGVATALLRAAEQQTQRRGVRKLTLRVLGTNARARRLYDRMGYREEGRLAGEFWIDGSAVDDILMAKRLGGPPGKAGRRSVPLACRDRPNAEKPNTRR